MQWKWIEGGIVILVGVSGTWPTIVETEEEED